MFPSSPIELFFFSSPKLFCFTRNFLFSFVYYFGEGKEKKKAECAAVPVKLKTPLLSSSSCCSPFFAFKQRATEAEERAQKCSGRGWRDEAPASPGGTGSLIMKCVVVSSQLAADELQRSWELGLSIRARLELQVCFPGLVVFALLRIRFGMELLQSLHKLRDKLLANQR